MFIPLFPHRKDLLRFLVYSAISCVIILSMTSCKNKNTSIYTAKNEVFQLKYPSDWYCIKTGNEIRRLLGHHSILQYALTDIEVFLYLENPTNGISVSKMSLPISFDSEMDALQYYKNLENSLFFKRNHGGIRSINRKKYYVYFEENNERYSKSAITYHDNRFYCFHFFCSAKEKNKYDHIFTSSMNSITFKGTKGFFTGLWHGLLLPFRFTASLFMDIVPFQKANGGWYIIGFLLGALPYLLEVFRRGR